METIESMRKKGYRVDVMHFAPFAFKTKFGKVKQASGATKVKISDDTNSWYGFSVCVEPNFLKKKGTAIALARAISHSKGNLVALYGEALDELKTRKMVS